MLKVLFVLEIFTFLFWVDKKDMSHLKVYYVTHYTTHNYNMHTLFPLISAGPQITPAL